MEIDRSLAKSLALHQSAVDALVARAEGVTDAAWFAPASEGKWSPAEVLAHLVCTYDTLLRELAGGQGMAIRTKRWQRWLLRLTILPRILAGGEFPRGAVAPRETRPTGTMGRAESLTLFRRRAAEFDEAARAAKNGQQITHAYFGAAKLAHGVRLCTRHIEHHAARLAG
ncbi:MAG: DinB family protein [Thermoanaerobaculia bacterium]|jgi:hypothetical protein